VTLQDMAEWHGFANGNAALFITPVDEDRVGLFMQVDRTTQLAAEFVDPAMAVMVMDWLDDALQKTAQANSALLERLQNDQPLTFPHPATSNAPDDTEELFGDEEEP